MAETNERIEQFRKMAEADPENELGHFSLGRAYLDAGRNAEAVESLERAVALNPNLSKAYQLIGAALLNDGRREEAIARLTKGIEVAADRGDLMPKNEMIAMLRELGAPLPEGAEKTAAVATPESVGEGEVSCVRCGRIGRKLAAPPFSHATGREIQEKVCADCWQEWIHMGTKVINELRLPLNDPQAQKVFDQHMREFLNLD